MSGTCFPGRQAVEGVDKIGHQSSWIYIFFLYIYMYICIYEIFHSKDFKE